jgi:hypothetical protein
MRNHGLLFAFAVICLFAASNASAELTPYYNTTPTDQCGAIDPNMACYIGVVNTSCPTVNSYDTCIKSCDCKYKKALEKCGSSVECKNVQTSERNACYGNCITDWS